MSTQEDRIETLLIKNQNLLIALVKAQMAMQTGTGKGYHTNNLKRALVSNYLVGRSL